MTIVARDRFLLLFGAALLIQAIRSEFCYPSLMIRWLPWKSLVGWAIRTAIGVALVSFVALKDVAAETYYLIDFDKNALIVASSTIHDVAPQQKVADVYDIGFMDADLGKFEFNCTSRRGRVLSHGLYALRSGKLTLAGTKEGAELSITPNSRLERLYAFICDWPNIDSTVESADFVDDAALVTSVSETILDTPAR
jgi:hypothetical protein